MGCYEHTHTAFLPGKNIGTDLDVSRFPACAFGSADVQVKMLENLVNLVSQHSILYDKRLPQQQLG